MSYTLQSGTVLTVHYNGSNIPSVITTSALKLVKVSPSSVSQEFFKFLPLCWESVSAALVSYNPLALPDISPAGFQSQIL